MFGNNIRRKRKTRWARKAQILNVLYYWAQHKGLTMQQVAFWLQLCPSTHLMGLLRELESEGLLKALEAHHRPNSIKYLWRLSDVGEKVAADHTKTGGWS